MKVKSKQPHTKLQVNPEKVALMNQKGMQITVTENGMIVKHMSMSIRPMKGSSSQISKAFSVMLKGQDSGDVEKLKKAGMSLAPEMVRIYTLRSADTKVDRAYDHFASSGLKDMSDLSPGKPIQKDHRWEVDYSVGKIFESYVGNASGQKRLVQRAYIIKDASTESLINKIDAGIVDKVSVSFAMDLNDYICDSCKNPIVSMSCKHMPGSPDPETGKEVTVTIKHVKDYFETSLVAVPCQPEARIGKESGDDQIHSGMKSKSVEQNNQGSKLEKTNNLDRISTGSSGDHSENGSPARGDGTVKTKSKAKANAQKENVSAQDELKLVDAVIGEVVGNLENAAKGLLDIVSKEAEDADEDEDEHTEGEDSEDEGDDAGSDEGDEGDDDEDVAKTYEVDGAQIEALAATLMKAHENLTQAKTKLADVVGLVEKAETKTSADAGSSDDDDASVKSLKEKQTALYSQVGDISKVLADLQKGLAAIEAKVDSQKELLSEVMTEAPSEVNKKLDSIASKKGAGAKTPVQQFSDWAAQLGGANE